MSYRQRTTETSILKAKGFVGVNSIDSNLTLDKSYIEKGTAFVNASKNSNVIIKDCGSPEPSQSVVSSFFSEQKNLLKDQKFSISLPPWLEYNVYKDVPMTGYTAEKYFNKYKTDNGFYIKLENILEEDLTPTSSAVITARNDILNNLSYSDNNEPFAPSSLSLDVALTKQKIDLNDVHSTQAGFFFLGDVDSSIKAVWPLNKASGEDLDFPKVNLHYISREVYDLKTNDGNTVKIDGIIKLDKTGQAELDEKDLTFELTPVHKKKIVTVVSNVVQYQKDKFYDLDVSSSDEGVHFNLKKEDDDERYRFDSDSPYFTIGNSKYFSYYKYNRYNVSIKTLENDDFPYSLYMKNIKGLPEGLYSLINKDYTSEFVPSAFIEKYGDISGRITQDGKNIDLKLDILSSAYNTTNNSLYRVGFRNLLAAPYHIGEDTLFGENGVLVNINGDDLVSSLYNLKATETLDNLPSRFANFQFPAESSLNTRVKLPAKSILIKDFGDYNGLTLEALSGKINSKLKDTDLQYTPSDPENPQDNEGESSQSQEESSKICFTGSATLLTGAVKIDNSRSYSAQSYSFSQPQLLGSLSSMVKDTTENKTSAALWFNPQAIAYALSAKFDETYLSANINSASEDQYLFELSEENTDMEAFKDNCIGNLSLNSEFIDRVWKPLIDEIKEDVYKIKFKINLDNQLDANRRGICQKLIEVKNEVRQVEKLSNVEYAFENEDLIKLDEKELNRIESLPSLFNIKDLLDKSENKEKITNLIKDTLTDDQKSGKDYDATGLIDDFDTTKHYKILQSYGITNNNYNDYANKLYLYDEENPIIEKKSDYCIRLSNLIDNLEIELYDSSNREIKESDYYSWFGSRGITYGEDKIATSAQFQLFCSSWSTGKQISNVVVGNWKILRTVFRWKWLFIDSDHNLLIKNFVDYLKPTSQGGISQIAANNWNENFGDYLSKRELNVVKVFETSANSLNIGCIESTPVSDSFRVLLKSNFSSDYINNPALFSFELKETTESYDSLSAAVESSLVERIADSSSDWYQCVNFPTQYDLQSTNKDTRELYSVGTHVISKSTSPSSIEALDYGMLQEKVASISSSLKSFVSAEVIEELDTQKNERLYYPMQNDTQEIFKKVTLDDLDFTGSDFSRVFNSSGYLRYDAVASVSQNTSVGLSMKSAEESEKKFWTSNWASIKSFNESNYNDDISGLIAGTYNKKTRISLNPVLSTGNISDISNCYVLTLSGDGIEEKLSGDWPKTAKEIIIANLSELSANSDILTKQLRDLKNDSYIKFSEDAKSNPPTTSYIVYNPFSASSDGEYLYNSASVYYNSKKLTKTTLIDNCVSAVFEESNSTLNSSIRLNTAGDQGSETSIFDDLPLYFDKECRYPLYINQNGNLIETTSNGIPIFDATARTNGTGTYVQLKKPDFETKKKYVFEDFYDWLDVDNYINYSYINSNTKSSYILDKALPWTFNVNENYAVLTGSTIDSCIEVSSKFNDTSYKLHKASDSTAPEHIAYADDYNLSTLFSASCPASSMYYKAFSFNFKIPEAGWKKLDSLMYAPDTVHYNKNANSFLDTGEFYDCNADLLKSLLDTSKRADFEGTFIARYRNLNTGKVVKENSNTVIPCSARYDDAHYYSVDFVARVRETDRELVGSDDDEVKLTIQSENTSLNFSMYLQKIDDQAFYDGIFQLKYLSFNYDADFLPEDGNRMIQLNDINVYARYDVGAVGVPPTLALSFVTTVCTKNTDLFIDSSIRTYHYVQEANDNNYLVPSGKSIVTGFLNLDLIHPAHSDMVNGLADWASQEQKTYADQKAEAEKLLKELDANKYDVKNYKSLTGQLVKLNQYVSSVATTVVEEEVKNDALVLDLCYDGKPVSSGYITYSNYIYADRHQFKIPIRKLHDANDNLIANIDSASTPEEIKNTLSGFLSIKHAVYGTDDQMASYTNDNPWAQFNKGDYCYGGIDYIKKFNMSSKNITNFDQVFYALVNYNTGYAYIAFGGTLQVNKEGAKKLSSDGREYKNSLYNFLKYISPKFPKYIKAKNSKNGKVEYFQLKTEKSNCIEIRKFGDSNFYIEPYTKRTACSIFNAGIFCICTSNVLNHSYDNCHAIIRYERVPNGKVPEDAVEKKSVSAYYPTVDYKPFNEKNAAYLKYTLGNLLNDNVDASNAFITWLAPGDLFFLDKKDSAKAAELYAQKSITSSLSSYVVSSYSVLSAENVDSETNNRMSYVKFIDPFVKPFDISTNLVHVDLSPSAQFIVNARKMYSLMDNKETKPESSSIKLDFGSLYNTDLVLTGFIPAGYLQQMYPFRNNKFEYVMSEDENITEGEEYNVPVRYTDLRDRGKQYNLYKLRSDDAFNVTFTTANDIEVEVIPKSNSRMAKSTESNNFKVPAKMSFQFKDLYFRKRIRSGSELDDPTKIEADEAMLASSFFNAKADFSTLSSRWGLQALNGESGTKYFQVDPKGKRIEYEEGESNSVFGYKIHIDRVIADPTYSFGGESYYNDVPRMTLVYNSAKSWTSDKYANEYEGMEVNSDYSPRTSRHIVVGTPYLNLDHVENIASVIGGESENSIYESYVLTTPFVKIATDDRIVDNISVNDELAGVEDWPEHVQIKRLTGFKVTRKFDNSTKTCTITVNVKAKIQNTADITQVGKLYIKLDNTGTGANQVNLNNNKNEETGKLDGQLIIYFDGMMFEKNAYINLENKKVNSKATGRGKDYVLNEIVSQDVVLYSNGEVKGTVVLKGSLANTTADSSSIEIHNVKPLAPVLKSFSIQFPDSMSSSIQPDGYMKIDNNLWSKEVLFNKKRIEYKYGSNELNNPFFSLFDIEGNSDIRIKSKMECKYNDKGEFEGWNVEMRFKGLKRFESASFSYYFDKAQSVVLSSQELLNDYHTFENVMEEGYEIENYTHNAKLNDTVQSGLLRCEPNASKTAPLDMVVPVGNYKYVYNPKGNNLFQLEVYSVNVVKESNRDKLNVSKSLYYVNLPVDRWYNMTLYSIVSGLQPQSNAASEYSSNKKFGIQLTDITADNLEDVPSKSKEVFSVYTPDKKITDGSHWTSGTLTASDISGVFNEISDAKKAEFDPCSRSVWACKYTDDGKYAFSEDASMEEYNKKSRKQRDLFLLSEDLTGFRDEYITKNSIKLFDNGGVKNLLQYINKIDESNKLSGYIPRRLYSNDTEKYALVKKDDEYHMRSISGMCAKSVMYISTPNLSKFTGRVRYYDTYRDSLMRLKEYISYFSDNAHKLPQVNSNYRILNSDYATLVYNSCEKKEEFKNITTVDGDYSTEIVVNSYTKDPTTIAYVWDNSQVTRNESCRISTDGELFAQDSKLYWSENVSSESVVEVGSLYNFKDAASVKNVVKIDVSSVNQRQTALMPVLGSPFDFVKKNDENGIVTVNDTIIATAALGYNSNGYPMNSMMVYNGRDAVKIDPSHTTYLYVSQKDDKNDCKFGATQEKPVYVDMPEVNSLSLNEAYDFLPSPTHSLSKSMEYYDIARRNATGGDNDVGYETNGIDLLSPTDEISYVSSTFKGACYSSKASISRWSIYDYMSKTVNVVDVGDDPSLTPIIVNFAGNITSFGITERDEVLKESGLNVFFDSEEWEEKVNQNFDNKCLSTINCYGFDGTLIDFTARSDQESIDKILKFTTTTKVNTRQEAVKNFLTDADVDGKEYIKEPTLYAIWSNETGDIDWSIYEDNITQDISRDVETAIFDNYRSVNLTSVRFKIRKEHFTNAPILIEFRFLKRVRKDSSAVFAWVYDSRYDFDIRDTFEDEYDLKADADKYFTHVFPVFTDKLDFIKNVYGIAITIKQIVPQMTNANPAVIDEIKIFCGNKLNNYSQAYTIKDTFVRKNEANCRNFYNFKVNEYIWNLPTTPQEWKTLSAILQEDIDRKKYKYINNNLNTSIIQALNSLTSSDFENTLSTHLQSNSEVDYNALDASYYITKSDGSTQLNDILSDNYLSDHENMTITWKYVDYVYIYYEAYSTHARSLLKKYFGNYIYNAVKNKLNANIDNLNANSAFADKFTFSGGIAIDKHENEMSLRNSTVFEWQSQNEVKNDWTEVHTKTQYDTYGTKTITTTGAEYRVEYHNGNVYSSSYAGTWSTSTDYKNQLYNTEVKETVHTELRKQTAISTAKVVVQNPNYVSAESWLASFIPVMIKYKID